MKNIIKQFSILAPALLGVTLAGNAQQTEKVNIVTSAVPFLRISPDARAGAMGETGIVSSPDANAQFYNVAKYAFASDQSSIGVTYTPWLRKLGLHDVYLASMAGYYKIDENQAVSGSLKYFSLGNLQLTDHNGNDLYTSNPREFSIDAGYSRKLSDQFSLGGALRYIHSNLGGHATSGTSDFKPGNAFAADLGFYYSKATAEKGGWVAGVAITNLGSKISYSSAADQKSFLPANIGLGVGHSWINDQHQFSLNGEINKLLVPDLASDATEEDYRKYNQEGIVSSYFSSFSNKAMAYSVGAEYIYDKMFALRAGYYADSRSLGERHYLTAGAGINYSFLGFNFSYLVPSGSGVGVSPLANTVRFSLLMNISGKDK